MNRVVIMLLFLCIPILSSERRRTILAGEKEKKFQQYTIPAAAGMYGGPLFWALADVAKQKQCPDVCSNCLIASGYISCAFSLLCGLFLCNECRKEWINHAKK